MRFFYAIDGHQVFRQATPEWWYEVLVKGVGWVPATGARFPSEQDLARIRPITETEARRLATAA